MNETTLSSLAGGALEERFQDELREVLRNIFDPNAVGEKVRAIVMTVNLKPNDELTGVVLGIEVRSKLQPAKNLVSFARIGLGPDGPVMREETSLQLPLFPPEARDPNKVIDIRKDESHG